MYWRELCPADIHKPGIYGNFDFVEPSANVVIKEITQKILKHPFTQDIQVFFASTAEGFNPGERPAVGFHQGARIVIDKQIAEARAAEDEPEEYAPGWYSDVTDRKRAFAAAVVLDTVSTVAHEVSHAILDKLKETLDPAEYKALTRKVLDIDTKFRWRVIDSFAAYFSPKNSGLQNADVAYLAGDPKECAEVYGNDADLAERCSGEFLAEMGSLVFIKKLKPADIPKPYQHLMQFMARDIKSGMTRFQKLLYRAKEQPNQKEHAQRVRDILETLDWAINKNCEASQKPDWLKSATKVPTVSPGLA